MAVTVVVFVFLVPAIALAAIGSLGWWLAQRAVLDGDRPDDAHSSVTPGPGGTVVVDIVNPGPTSIVVGWRFRPALTPAPLATLCPTLVVRPARRWERRRSDRGAAGLLGVVEAHDEQRWTLPAPGGRARLHVILGLRDARLRVHDHAVPGTGPVGLTPGFG